MEEEVVGWHQRLDGHEFEQASGVGDGQESQQSNAADSCALQETSTGETSGAKMCSPGTSTQATLDLEGEPPPSFKVSQASY